MNWWNRLTNRDDVALRKEKGESLNRRERRLLKEKNKQKDVGQSYVCSVINGRTLNPYAVAMADEWRKKHGITNSMSRNERKVKSRGG